jgi:hypothetical protein
LKRAALLTEDVVVPSTALAQVWRGSARQALLGRLLPHLVLAPLDPMTREVGLLCGRTRTRDICDAHVALIASRGARLLYTSDPGDMNTLLQALGNSTSEVVRC